MKLKDIPVTERPREKLIRYGKENLSDAELLSIILKTGTKDCSVNDLSINIIKEIGGIEHLKDVSINSLLSIKGIGNAKATELLVLSELVKRINKKNDINRIRYTSPEIIYNQNKDLFDGLMQEYFYCVYLNSRKELIERKLLFMGTLNKSVVHPREVFKEAYKLSASSIVCLHNHPSGDITPSVEDVIFTNSLVKIGKINGIPIVDHLIIADGGYYSFYENNRLVE